MKKNVVLSFIFMAFCLMAKGEKIYDAKSGTFVMETNSVMGKSISTICFDDYGRSMRVEIKGGPANMVMIVKNKKMYSLFPESKTYME